MANGRKIPKIKVCRDPHQTVNKKRNKQSNHSVTCYECETKCGSFTTVGTFEKCRGQMQKLHFSNVSTLNVLSLGGMSQDLGPPPVFQVLLALYMHHKCREYSNLLAMSDDLLILGYMYLLRLF